MLMLTSCGGGNSPLPDGEGTLGGSDEGFGEKLEDLGVYDGYFDGESEEIEIKCISGTDGAYTLEGGVLSFSGIGEDSVYSLSGKLSGSVTIDAGEYKFELELRGASIVSRTASPISVISADKFTLSAKKDMKS